MKAAWITIPSIILLATVLFFLAHSEDPPKKNVMHCAVMRAFICFQKIKSLLGFCRNDQNCNNTTNIVAYNFGEEPYYIPLNHKCYYCICYVLENIMSEKQACILVKPNKTSSFRF